MTSPRNLFNVFIKYHLPKNKHKKHYFKYYKKTTTTLKNTITINN